MAEPGPRLADGDVDELLGRAEELLGRLEQVPGATGELGLAAVAALAELYGEALARVVDLARGTAGGAAVLRALTGDELVGHLLALHGVHPDPLEQRVARAVDRLRLELSSLGRDITLLGVDDGARGAVARVRLGGGGGGCGSSGPTEEQVQELVRDVVTGAAPEVTSVLVEKERPAAAFVPLDALLRAPAGVVR